ncbi:MAG: twin-arginine translocation signal domain-containing protein [Phycisphaerales bacterium]|nr:MAG: twin-arginine translocation signal domain-containing protein [Phycisphaerales bacterium]
MRQSPIALCPRTPHVYEGDIQTKQPKVSRRDFLGGAAAAAAFTVVPPVSSPGPPLPTKRSTSAA